VFQNLDANQVSGAGGANSLVMTSKTTTQAGDLILAAFGTISANITAGTSPNAFTIINTPSGGNGAEYFIQSSAGAIAPTAGDSSSAETWAAIMVAFKNH